jgi:hypothetical protein
MAVSDIAETAKSAGVILTTLSGFAYACGYLVVRARARALGTDPGFVLIDQAYVFAGFRFVLAVLFALLVMALPLLLLYEFGRLAAQLAPPVLLTLETVAAVAAGVATVWAYSTTFAVTGVLLTPATGWAAEAALERNQRGMWITLGTTALAAAVLLWLDAHLGRAGRLDTIGIALLLIGMLLLVLLPVQHGVFYADRAARQLERVPAAVPDLVAPIWLIDRGGAERVVLYARTADGQPRLVTVKAELLEGIAVTGVMSLDAVVGRRSA